MAGRSPLHGYNTNYRREGISFHVQTEDLGEPLAAIVTQVFSGGTILAKERTEYKDILGAEDLEVQLRARMQKQHKALLLALRDGKIDTTPLAAAAKGAAEAARAHKAVEHLDGIDPMRDTLQMVLPPEFYEDIAVEGRDGVIIDDFPPPEKPQVVQAKPAAPAAKPPEPPAAKPPEPPAPKPPEPAPAKPPEPPPRNLPTPPPPPAPTAAVPKTVQPPTIRVAPPPPPKLSPKATQIGIPPMPPQARKPPPPPAAAQAPAPPRHASAPPPPPAPSAAPPPIPTGLRPESRPSSKPPPQRAPVMTNLSKLPSSAPPELKRPRIFADVSPRARPNLSDTEDQLGERSLDEVILSYLADDLQDD